VNLENPLPLTIIFMDVKEISKKPVFSWTFESPEIPDHFNLYEETSGQPVFIANIKAINQQNRYNWTCNYFLDKGIHFFRISMVDIHGNEYSGNIVPFNMEDGIVQLNWLGPDNQSGFGKILIQSDQPDIWKYEIISIQGQIINRGVIKLELGKNYLMIGPEIISRGIYVFEAMNSSGSPYSLIFKK
jgi:hypothetical protein